MDREDDEDERSAYEILGVKETASREEIRRRFVALSKVHHPARDGDDRRGDDAPNQRGAYAGAVERRRETATTGLSERRGRRGGPRGRRMMDER